MGCIWLKQPWLNLLFPSELCHTEANMWACPVHEEYERSLDVVTASVYIQVLKYLYKHFGGHKSLKILQNIKQEIMPNIPLVLLRIPTLH